MPPPVPPLRGSTPGARQKGFGLPLEPRPVLLGKERPAPDTWTFPDHRGVSVEVSGALDRVAGARPLFAPPPRERKEPPRPLPGFGAHRLEAVPPAAMAGVDDPLVKSFLFFRKLSWRSAWRTRTSWKCPANRSGPSTGSRRKSA